MSRVVLKQAIKIARSNNEIIKARNSIWKAFLEQKCNKAKSKGVKIALLNAPCHGFGDVIFARKLTSYLNQWYNCDVKIFTTLPDAHIKLGANKDDIYKVKKTTKQQCRIFRNLDFIRMNEKFDLFLIAPAVATYSPKISDIIKKFKYATKTNVFSFSEYNSTTANIDFRTGIGGKRLGMLFTKPPRTSKIRELKNPYVMLYIAGNEYISNATRCYRSFMEMITKKYHKTHKKLDIVVPKWIAEEINKNTVKNIREYYPTILVKTKQEKTTIIEGKGNILTIRGDIYPLNNTKMFSLIKYSLKDILVTGDQSITDVLSCCSDKNIFYQIAEWKENFAMHLAKLLPNKYLLSKKTSCGTIKAIRYKSNYTKFMREWDFRIKGRPFIDALVLSVVAIRDVPEFKKLSDAINNKRTMKTLRESLATYFNK